MISNANAEYWMKVAKEERDKAAHNMQIAADRAGEIDRMRVALTKKDAELDHLQDKALVLINHLVKFDNYTGYEAIVQEVLFLIPLEKREQ
jgi:hypothetical protein